MNANEALEQVRALHEPVNLECVCHDSHQCPDSATVCPACQGDWPCPTAAILDAATPDAPVAVERAYFQVASIHHLHDGRHCLCGFDSWGRARSATEHILDEYRAVLTPATPERTEQEREAAVERVADALRPWLLGLGTLTLGQVNDLAPEFARAALAAIEEARRG